MKTATFFKNLFALGIGRRKKRKKAKLDERFSADTPSTLTKLVEDYLEHRHRKAERDELSERTVGTDEYVLPLFLDWVELNTELCSPTSSV